MKTKNVVAKMLSVMSVVGLLLVSSEATLFAKTIPGQPQKEKSEIPAGQTPAAASQSNQNALNLVEQKNVVQQLAVAPASALNLTNLLQSRRVSIPDFNTFFGTKIPLRFKGNKGGANTQISAQDKVIISGIEQQLGITEAVFINTFPKANQLNQILKGSAASRAGFNQFIGTSLGAGIPNNVDRKTLFDTIQNFAVTNVAGFVQTVSQANDINNGLQSNGAVLGAFNNLFNAAISNGPLSQDNRNSLLNAVSASGFSAQGLLSVLGAANETFNDLKANAGFLGSYNRFFGASVQSAGNLSDNNRRILLSNNFSTLGFASSNLFLNAVSKADEVNRALQGSNALNRSFQRVHGLALAQKGGLQKFLLENAANPAFVPADFLNTTVKIDELFVALTNRFNKRKLTLFNLRNAGSLRTNGNLNQQNLAILTGIVTSPGYNFSNFLNSLR